MKSIKLKLFTPWKHLDTYSDEWDKRLMPGNKIWKSDKFALSWTHNANEADYHVIMNFPQHDAKYSPDKAILLRMEPAKLFMGTPFQNPEPSIYRYLFSQRSSLEWHLGRSFDQLTIDLLPENDLKISLLKTKVISTITSGLQVDPGHRLRYQFLSYLEDFKGFDFFGRDHSTNKAYRGPLTNRVKDDGLIPYKYTVAAENNWEANYFTEKIVDAILAECLCFYWGCPNIEQYIDERAFIRIPIERPLEAVEIIKKAIDNDEYSKRLPYIRAMKKKIVNELQIMPTLSLIIDEIQEQEKLFNQLFVDKASLWRLLPNNKISPGLLQQLPQIYNQSKHLDNLKLGDKIAVKFNSDISSFVNVDSKEKLTPAIKSSLASSCRSESKGVTIVTGFWSVLGKHNKTEYEQWISNFAKLECNMVIFTDLANYKFIKGLRHPNITRVYLKELEDFTCDQYQDYWNYCSSIAPEQKHSSQLYMISAERHLTLVQEAIKLDTFKSEYYLWLDIGSLRKQEDLVNMSNFLTLSKVKACIGDKFTVSSPPTSTAPVVNVIQGLFLGSHKILWKMWGELYLKHLTLFMDNGTYGGNDQVVIDHIFTTENNDKLKLIQTLY